MEFCTKFMLMISKSYLIMVLFDKLQVEIYTKYIKNDKKYRFIIIIWMCCYEI